MSEDAPAYGSCRLPPEVLRELDDLVVELFARYQLALHELGRLDEADGLASRYKALRRRLNPAPRDVGGGEAGLTIPAPKATRPLFRGRRASRLRRLLR